MQHIFTVSPGVGSWDKAMSEEREVSRGRSVGSMRNEVVGSCCSSSAAGLEVRIWNWTWMNGGSGEDVVLSSLLT